MTSVLLAGIVIAAAVLLYNIFRKKKVVPLMVQPVSDNYKLLLQQEVPFYTKLSMEKQQEFQQRVQQFLTSVTITGVKTTVEEIDRILIAAGAVIPIFNFKDWHYTNLHEVLLYPDSFTEEFNQQGQGRNILGMVGSGAMNNIMILSQPELRDGFTNKSGKTNTAIHEFVHLVDKTDGSIDGMPSFFADKQLLTPWLKRMHQEIALILQDKSDINPYGASSESEFFAVAAEYFFERPDLLEQKHPELYALLVKIFNPDGGHEKK